MRQFRTVQFQEIFNYSKGVHLTDEYRDNVNRFKKVPAIVDNGFQLSESVAIFRYLAARNKIDDQWYPKNDQIRGRIDEYLEWQHYHTRQTCAQYFMLAYMKPLTIGSSPGDAQVIASAETQMNQTLDMIENLWLRPGRFISGTNQLSFADILAACEIEQPSTIFQISESHCIMQQALAKLCFISIWTAISGYDPTVNRPNLAEWWKLVRQLTNPVYDEAHVILNKLREKEKAKL